MFEHPFITGGSAINVIFPETGFVLALANSCGMEYSMISASGIGTIFEFPFALFPFAPYFFAPYLNSPYLN
jgi:hypothetical protein